MPLHYRTNADGEVEIVNEVPAQDARIEVLESGVREALLEPRQRKLDNLNLAIGSTEKRIQDMMRQRDDLIEEMRAIENA